MHALSERFPRHGHPPMPEAVAATRPAPMPTDRILLVLLGLPLGSLLVSLPLLGRDAIAAAGFEFRLLQRPNPRQL